MKKILIVLLIVCFLIISYMYYTHDTDPTFNKVYDWAQKAIPEKIAEMYVVKSYDIVTNSDGTTDIILHCEKNGD